MSDLDIDALIIQAELDSHRWPRLLGQALKQQRAELDALRVTNKEKKMSNTESVNSMFEIATRTKLRFASTKGELSIEQLWEVPLRSKDDFNLDVIARSANKALKALTEESFVETTRSPAQTKMELALDLIKYVIETKKDEEDTAKKRAANKIEKEKLLEILADKQAGKLSELSEKELQNRIKALET